MITRLSIYLSIIIHILYTKSLYYIFDAYYIVCNQDYFKSNNKCETAVMVFYSLVKA